jgi:predicted nucleic acid-binding protein
VKLGIDSNVLLQAHLPALDRHELAHRYLHRQLALPGVTLILTPLVLHEFVHVVTDGRRFDPPVAMTEALTLARGYLGRSNVECIATDEASLLLALDLLSRHNLGRKRIADTLFAATLLAHGVHRLVTFNVADFKLFEGLTAVEPAVRNGDPEDL